MRDTSLNRVSLNNKLKKLKSLVQSISPKSIELNLLRFQDLSFPGILFCC